MERHSYDDLAEQFTAANAGSRGCFLIRRGPAFFVRGLQAHPENQAHMVFDWRAAAHCRDRP